MNIIATAHVKRARKSHRCDWCNEPIAVGDPYVRQRNCDGPDVWTYRAHAECWEAAERMDRDDLESDQQHGVVHVRGCEFDRFEPCECARHKAMREGGDA